MPGEIKCFSKNIRCREEYSKLFFRLQTLLYDIDKLYAGIFVVN